MKKNKNQPEGFADALMLFKESARHVPAYKSFLKQDNINPASVNSYENFRKIPAVDKNNYLKANDFFDLFPRRKIPDMISASSGSSGKPFFWPRGKEQEEIGGRLHERILHDIFGVKKDEKTLIIVCFSMGTWIAGTFTMASARWLASRGYNISVITPSIEKEDVVGILCDLAPLFDRTVLAGYPPFLRDAIEEALTQKINFKKLRLNLLFAGENFSEKYRKIMHELCGIKDRFGGSVSIYGTADAGAVGYETPISIFIRKTASEDKKFASLLELNDSFMPTIVQYNPRQVFFELEGGEMLFTTRAGIPLIRYNIRDTGKLITHGEMRVILKARGIFEKAKKLGFEKWRIPFIFLGLRADVATTFYALNIYPENIKAGLEDKDVYKFVSGKFIAYTRLFDKGRKQKLFIEVELARNVALSAEIASKIRRNVFEKMIRLNMEYRKLYHSLGAKKTLPNVILIPFGDARFTLKKSKHRWLKKE